jgi:hypothetical protein
MAMAQPFLNINRDSHTATHIGQALPLVLVRIYHLSVDIHISLCVPIIKTYSLSLTAVCLDWSSRSTGLLLLASPTGTRILNYFQVVLDEENSDPALSP